MLEMLVCIKNDPLKLDDDFKARALINKRSFVANVLTSAYFLQPKEAYVYED